MVFNCYDVYSEYQQDDEIYWWEHDEERAKWDRYREALEREEAEKETQEEES